MQSTLVGMDHTSNTAIRGPQVTKYRFPSRHVSVAIRSRVPSASDSRSCQSHTSIDSNLAKEFHQTGDTLATKVHKFLGILIVKPQGPLVMHSQIPVDTSRDLTIHPSLAIKRGQHHPDGIILFPL